MLPTIRKVPAFAPRPARDPNVAATAAAPTAATAAPPPATGAGAGSADDATPPPGWQAPAPGSNGRAAYRRTDGAEVFFDRRSRSDDPLDAVRPGWNWMARRPEGTMLGHRVAAPVGGPVPEGGLFLPKKFKTAGEAMRALDRDAPAPGAAPAKADSTAAGAAVDGVPGALARLESRGGELLGPDGTLLPRIGLSWAQVALEGPLTLAALPAAGTTPGAAPRGALANAREAAARGLPVVPINEEDARALRRLAEKLIAAPGEKTARAAREFLDFLVAGVAAPATADSPKTRKRILLKAAA